LRRLEDIPIHFLDHYYHLDSGRIDGLTGVWVKNARQQDAKIAAIGVKLRRWITMHGMSINIDPEMEYFQNIVPCGIADKPVTSLQALLTDATKSFYTSNLQSPPTAEPLQLSFRQTADELIASFQVIFERDCEVIPEAESLQYLQAL